MDDFDFSGKRVLVRVDFNSAIINGRIELSERIIAHSKTVKELISKGARIVLLAHQGRPGEHDFTHLNQHAVLLSKALKRKVRFVDDIIGGKAIQSIKRLKRGEVLLLDNVRMLPEEMLNLKPEKHAKSMLVKKLTPLFDIFVSDAFSASHRSHASIVGFALTLPSCAGRVMEKETNALKEFNQIKHPSVYVLSGAKPDDVLNLANYALRNKMADKILAAGFFGLLCLIARGYRLGGEDSFFEKLGYLKLVPKIKSLIKRYDKKILTPRDFAILGNGKRREIELQDLPVSGQLYDIGKETIKEYCEVIKNAEMVFVKGTPGYYEEKEFSLGTETMLKAIEKSGAFSLVGGGHALSAINHFKINKNKISHISLGGGVLMKYLSGEKLPAVEVLKQHQP